jgi:hypothetical protein
VPRLRFVPRFIENPQVDFADRGTEHQPRHKMAGAPPLSN